MCVCAWWHCSVFLHFYSGTENFGGLSHWITLLDVTSKNFVFPRNVLITVLFASTSQVCWCWLTVSYLIHGWQWLEVTRNINARTIQSLRAAFAFSRRQTFAKHGISHSRETLQEACESKIANFFLGIRSSWMHSSLSWGHIKGRRG